MRQHRDIYRIKEDIYHAALALQAQYPGGSPDEMRSWEAARSCSEKADVAGDVSAWIHWKLVADFLYWRECASRRCDLVLIDTSIAADVIGALGR